AEHAHEEIVLLVGALRRGEAGQGVAAAGLLDAQQLLGGELHRLLPGGLAERIVPCRRCRDAVADVHIEALEQRQLAHRLAGGPRRRPRLRPLALGFDGLPWPAAALRSLPAFRSEEHTSELQSRENL